ncbi:WD40 domain-containing protein [Coleofasciculus sp.]|uniref:WD40 domain-containing protein n=1 Tax=Coleofasciculus sp. TaxID=3100458 RepID=UPI0039FACE42
MKEQERAEEIVLANERSLSTLARAITLSEGQFALILVRCNYQCCKQPLWQKLQGLTGIPLKQLVLQESSQTLYTVILDAIAPEEVSALLVFGLESVTAIDPVLISTNQVRDEFPKSFTFPIVLWVTDELLHKLARFAPDFKSWAATSIKFELATAELLHLWEQTTEELFTTLLDKNVGEFLSNEALKLAPGCQGRQELESALRDLQARDVSLEPAQYATWQFILARDAFRHDLIEVALEQYQRSLDVWQQIQCAVSDDIPKQSLERIGILLCHLGWCYCRQAQLHPNHKYRSWERAREFWQGGIDIFTTAGRLDWVAHLTIQLGEVLQNLQNWADLQALALQSLAQSQTQDNAAQLPQAYGFLAAVALEESNWEDAKVFAQTALDILENSQLFQPQHQGWYLLIRAKAQRQLGESTAAIADLETALTVEGLLPKAPHQSPQLYLDILQQLRSLYFDHQKYLRAFELKQKQRSLEQQYGFFTFLGAAPLLSGRAEQQLSPLEIAAAGRLPDVNRLLERLSRNDHKLTVIHGSSGVGKSSLIHAGLVPALASRTISAREVIPVVQKVYRDWRGEFSRQLTQGLGCTTYPSSDTALEPQSLTQLPTSLDQLQQAADGNVLIVLIFDQFEEFFFVCTDLEQRRQFYGFLEHCLNLPFVKVILSLREDYLHYLLECERYTNLSAINNNILDRQLRYHLGDLSPQEAKNVISTLASGSQFKLDDALIDALVQDLASPTQSVRLIELQVVGMQLQAEKITTLAQYQALGTNPKATLVERWLISAIADCGSENADTVWHVLFSLTDDRGTRPLKTQTELESGTKDLDMGQTPSPSIANSLPPLPLILEILVGAGLLFRLPDEPEDRYQLVHDYLVAPIRHHYKKRRKLTLVTRLQNSQMELLRIRKQRLGAIAVGMAMAVLAVTAGGLGWRAEVQRRRAETLTFNAQLGAISASSEALFASGKEFDALLEGLRAARQLKHVAVKVEPDTHLQVIAALSQAVDSVTERNRLEGHSDIVWDVSFSPDGELIASASRDGRVKLWRPDGTLVTTLQGHQDSVTSVSFSPDSQLIASSSWDGTVKLWRRDGTLVRTLSGHNDYIYSVTFSPNGKRLASTGADGMVRLWQVDGQLIRTISAHKNGAQWVSFSPNGEILASAGSDQTIKLWTEDGQLWKTLTGHKGKVNSVAFSPDGQLIASASDDRTVKLWNTQGQLIKTLSQPERWVLNVTFSADSQLIAAASADNTVRLWNRDGMLLKTFKGHSDRVTAVSFSPTKQAQETPNSPATPVILASASYDKTIKLWQLRQQSQLILRGHDDDVVDVTFSPDGEMIATASNDKTVKVWNRLGQLLSTLNGHTERIYSVSFSPDGERIASASRDGTIRLWNRQGQFLKVLNGHQDWVLDVSFSPDSQQLASASRDKTVKLWTRDGVLIKTLKGHQSRVNGVSFSPDGQLLASASDDQTVKLWTVNGELLKTLKGHSNWVLDVSFSADSELLASASYDNTVKVWNRQGKLQTTLKGSTDSVARVQFSPRGNILATTSWDNRVQIWRLDDTLVKTWEAEEGRVTSVSWSQDGQALAVGTEDNMAIVWNLDLENLLSKSCNWLRDYLNHNPDVKQSNRELCQPIAGEKVTP